MHLRPYKLVYGKGREVYHLDMLHSPSEEVVQEKTAECKLEVAAHIKLEE